MRTSIEKNFSSRICIINTQRKFVNKNKPSSSSTYVSNPESKPISRPRVSNSNLPIYEFSLSIDNTNSTAKILLDTGSQINLMDIYYVKENNIPYSTKTNFPKVSGIDGKQNILGKTLPISITYKNHKCKTQFYVVDLPSYCAILGFEWISTHNPDIDFKNKVLRFNSNYCVENCLIIPNSFTSYVPLNTTKQNDKNENEEINNKISKSLPKKLLPFIDTFSKIYTDESPPYCPFDSEIKLKQNEKLHYDPIYPLTEKESLASKKYIKENEDKKFIRKSKSPAAASVLFVPKKDINDLFRIHKPPSDFFSDKDSQFTSKFWSAICKSFNITTKLASPFHHQTNGLTERVNSFIEHYLSCYSNFKGSDWYNFLFLAEFSYNNSIQ